MKKLSKIFAILICVFVVFMAAMAMSDNMDNVGTFITIAFLAGILYENDCEYPVAKSLAEDVIVNRMFEPIDEETYKKACAKIDESDYVIDTGCQVGAMNKRLKDLIEYAKKQGKKVLVKPDRDALKQLV